MSLKVTAPPRSTAYITLPTLKERLEISGTSEDALLTRELAGICSAIDVAAAYTFARTTYRESWSGSSDAPLRTRTYLSRVPVEPESLLIAVNGDLVTDWELEEPETGLLFREAGWPSNHTGAATVAASYRAGYLLPGDVSDWAAETEYAEREFVRGDLPSLLRFECVSAGESGAEAPTWPTIAGESVADGEVSWVARAAWEIPDCFQEWAYGGVLARRAKRKIPEGLASLTTENFEASWFATGQASMLPQSILDGIASFRAGLGGMA